MKAHRSNKLARAMLAAGLLAPLWAQADTVRIAVIDPISGPFAALGENGLHSWQMIAGLANREKWAGEHKFEVGWFDNKGSPQESLSALKTVTDQGYRYIAEAAGSGVALALIDALNKHAARAPGKEILFLNYGASDPDLNNSKCSFWHFRFESNTFQKLDALTNYMASDRSIKKVYLINQNYAFGHQFVKGAKEYLAAKRPDIQIVGDDLHPIGLVKDFAPYVAKIKSSGADTVMTGNWGSDLGFLIRAVKDANLNISFYTFNARTNGVPTVMGAYGAGRVKAVTYWSPNNETFSGKEIVEAFKKQYNDDFLTMPIYTAIATLAKGIKKAGSTDPVKVALAMEGMKVESLSGEAEMRKSDHQIQQALFVESWTKVNGKDVRYGQENTGYGWKAALRIPASAVAHPTTCQMKRPAP